MGGTVVSLDDLWGRDAVRIQERLRDAASWDDRFAIAEAALARRGEAGRLVDPEVAFAWEQMVTNNGGFAPSGWQPRSDRAANTCGPGFDPQLRLTPKRAAQLVRFDYATHRLAAGHSAALVAAECGYVNQSHLHRDVMTFAGVTPTAVAVAP